jgi:hypothetical protein
MANSWTDTDISFHEQHLGETNALEIGKTHDELPSRLDASGQKITDEDHTEDVKKHLPPWVQPPSDIDNTLQWEIKREKKLLDLRNHPTYQFVMLVAGYTDEPMEKYYNNQSEDSHEHTGSAQVGEVTAGGCSSTSGANCEGDPHTNMRKNIRLHEWYIDTPWADSLIFLSASLFAHIEEGYVAVTGRWPHLNKYKLSAFTESPSIRTIFAKLVAMLIRSSNVIAGKRYALDATYKRLHLEKRRLIEYWRNVKGENGVLYRCVHNQNPLLSDEWGRITGPDMQETNTLLGTDLETMVEIQNQVLDNSVYVSKY